MAFNQCPRNGPNVESGNHILDSNKALAVYIWNNRFNNFVSSKFSCRNISILRLERPSKLSYHKRMNFIWDNEVYNMIAIFFAIDMG